MTTSVYNIYCINQPLILRLLVLILWISTTTSRVYGQICVGEPGRVQWKLWQNIYDDEFSDLYAVEFYPTHPDISMTLYSLNAPVNYDNYFGATISGFIHVPVSDSVSFNITGNQKVQFFLSPDQNPDNKVLEAYSTDFTNEYEHDKFPTQTSSKKYLQSGQYYYFELQYMESTSSDHCKLFWKTSFLSNPDWNIITAAYLNDIGCLPTICPPRGTSCDDNNPNTLNDLQDGHCHCIGTPTTANTCIGAHQEVQSYRYDNITGNTLSSLYSAPHYPGMPNTSENLGFLGMHSTSTNNNFGTLVQGYLTVPVTGTYQLNLTGDDQTVFFMSSNEDPANKNFIELMVTSWSTMTDHNKFPSQTSAPITLNAGQYYYYEINHKEGSGNEHFGVFWKTPFQQPNTWKRIPSFYTYDYTCEVACINEGTPCDDGNPFTNNDQYDNNCTCVGTPCSGPDCNSPLANYEPYEKCGLTDQVSNEESFSWLSCNPSDNPNTSRNRSHWIKYDLGNRHRLINAHIWNYNVAHQTSSGFEQVVIDISEDGSNWTEIGSYFWPLATGDTQYSGFLGPDFGEMHARYVLITSLDDTLSCRGLTKIAFKAIICPSTGTPCDDGNSLTIFDTYDNDCQCTGQNISKNTCTVPDVVLGDSTIYTQVYDAIHTVTSISTIDGSSIVGLVGGKSVTLDVGFESLPNAVFVAAIDTCTTGNKNNALSASTSQVNQIVNSQKQELPELFYKTIPDTDLVDIYFNVSQKGVVSLAIESPHSNEKFWVIQQQNLLPGRYKKRIRTKKLPPLSSVRLITSSNAKNIDLILDATK